MEAPPPVSVRITGSTRIAGLFGFPVSHSLSPVMHCAAYEALGLNWAYVPFNVPPESIPAAVASIRALNMVGANVTVPHKAAVIPHLDWIDEGAARIGSVNTIHNVDGKLHGYSTDGRGYLTSIRTHNIPLENRDVLVLGAGGSARAIVFALAFVGAQITLSNRTTASAQELASSVNAWYPHSVTVIEWGKECGPVDLIVNTTTMGMSSTGSETPILPPGMPYAGQIVYDIIYTPMETPLLKLAKKIGCEAYNGVGMLVYQGVHSLSIWSGIPVNDIPATLMENVVLRELQNR